MSKRARRILFTLAVCVFAALIIWVVVYGKSRPNRPGQAPTNGTSVAQQPQQPTASQPASAAPTSTAPVTAASATQPATGPSLTPAPALPGLRATAAGNDLGSRAQPPTELGSLDPRRDALHVRLSRFGAGIERIEFSNMWQTSLAAGRPRGTSTKSALQGRSISRAFPAVIAMCLPRAAQASCSMKQAGSGCTAACR